MTISTRPTGCSTFNSPIDSQLPTANHDLPTTQLVSKGAAGEPSASLQLIAKNLKAESKPSRIHHVASFDPKDTKASKQFYRKLCGSYEAAELYGYILFLWQLNKNGNPKVENIRREKSGDKQACYWWGRRREKLAEHMGWTLEQLKYRLKTLKSRGLIDTISAKTKGHMMQIRPTVAHGAAALSGWPDASNYQDLESLKAEGLTVQDMQPPNSSPASEEDFLTGLGGKIPHLNTSMDKEEFYVEEKAYKPCDPIGSHNSLEKYENSFKEKNQKNYENSKEKETKKVAKVKKAKTLPYPPPSEPQENPLANYFMLEAGHDMKRLLEICADAGFAKATWKMMPDAMCALLLEIKSRLAHHPSYSLEEILVAFGISNQFYTKYFGPLIKINGWDRYTIMRVEAHPNDEDHLWECKPNLKSLLADFGLILDWLGPDALATDEEGTPAASEGVVEALA